MNTVLQTATINQLQEYISQLPPEMGGLISESLENQSVFIEIPDNIFQVGLTFTQPIYTFGKIGNAEVDFIATTADEKMYIQVTESMMSEDVRKRELSPLQSIRDNYEKIVLSLEPGLDTSYDGIKSESLIDWLLSE